MASGQKLALRLWKRAACFAHSRAGNFATLTALTAPVAIVLAAFAIDASMLYIERRNLQSLADLAAISAADRIASAETAAVALLRDNGYGASGRDGPMPLLREDGEEYGITVITGVYAADPLLAAEHRFAPGAEPPNAARISLRYPGTRYFSASFFATPAIGASAVAATRDEAAFSIGSRLARLDDGIANAILSSLTGSTISLTAVDYEALLSTDMRLLSLLDALDSQLGLEAANYNELLLANATIGDIVAAAANADGIGAAASAAAGKLAAQLSGGENAVSLVGLFDVGSLGVLPAGSASAQNDTHLGLMEILTAAAALSAANGEHHVETDLGTSLAGLADVTVKIAIGEPPQHKSWFSVGGKGALARTAQTRVLVELRLGGSGILSGVSLRLPIFLELAYGEASVERITCMADRHETPRVTIAARPGVARLRIGDVADADLARFDRSPVRTPARLLSLPLATISGYAEAEIGNRTATNLLFSAADIENRVTKRVSTTEITGSLTQSLLAGMDIRVTIVGFSLLSDRMLRDAALGALQASAPAIDAALASILETLGLAVGETDITVHDAACGSAVLVQ